MSYVDGFVIAVPTVNKQALIDHAGQFDPIFSNTAPPGAGVLGTTCPRQADRLLPGGGGQGG